MHCTNMQGLLPRGREAEREGVSGALGITSANLMLQNQRKASREAAEQEAERRCRTGCALCWTPTAERSRWGVPSCQAAEGGTLGGADLYFGHRTKFPHPIGHLRRLGEELTCSTATGGQGQGTVSWGSPMPHQQPPRKPTLPFHERFCVPFRCQAQGWVGRCQVLAVGLGGVINPNCLHQNILSPGTCLCPV